MQFITCVSRDEIEICFLYVLSPSPNASYSKEMLASGENQLELLHCAELQHIDFVITPLFYNTNPYEQSG